MASSVRFILLLQFLGLALGAFTHQSEANASVWETKEQWNNASEDEFSNWIRTLPLNFLSAEGSKYGKISTDCADAAYALRIIYAYEHGLPVQFKGSSDMRNSTVRFDSEADEIKRVRKFLYYVLNETNTRTLVNDTYPIAINRKTLRPGTLYLNPEPSSKQIKDLGIPAADRSGHVYYIQQILENGMIRYFSSTVPAMVRDLQPRIGITFAPFAPTGGFRAWKMPDVSDDKQPGFSLEQFKFGGWHPNDFLDSDSLWENWQAVVRNRLALRQATDLEEFQAKLFNVQGYVKERANLVNMGWSLYQKKYKGASCMDASDYDDYSTPSRDVKIQNELIDLKAAAMTYLRSQGQDGEAALSSLFAHYHFNVGKDVSLDLNDLWRSFETSVVLVISEPEHSPSVRWGLKPQGSWPCPERMKNYKNMDQAQ